MKDEMIKSAFESVLALIAYVGQHCMCTRHAGFQALMRHLSDLTEKLVESPDPADPAPEVGFNPSVPVNRIPLADLKNFDRPGETSWSFSEIDAQVGDLIRAVRYGEATELVRPHLDFLLERIRRVALDLRSQREANEATKKANAKLTANVEWMRKAVRRRIANRDEQINQQRNEIAHQQGIINDLMNKSQQMDSEIQLINAEASQLRQIANDRSDQLSKLEKKCFDKQKIIDGLAKQVADLRNAGHTDAVTVEAIIPSSGSRHPTFKIGMPHSRDVCDMIDVLTLDDIVIIKPKLGSGPGR